MRATPKPDLLGPLSDKERAHANKALDDRINWCARHWAKALRRSPKGQRRAYRYLWEMYGLIKMRAVVEGVPIEVMVERVRGMLALKVFELENWWAKVGHVPDAWSQQHKERAIE